MRAVVNDAMFLHDLASLSTLTVPLQVPATWMTTEWLDGIDFNVRASDNFFRARSNTPTRWQPKSKFQTSAILSTHVESTTLPLR